MTHPAIHTYYSGRATNWPALAISTALAVPLVATAVTADGTWRTPGIVVPLVVVTLTVLVNVVTASSVRAIAGPHGVTVHFGVFGWPRFHYPAARIRRAEAVDIPSSQWAWGIYWSPRRGLMLTLRTGPALRLTLDNGRRITVSTPTPADAVDAMNIATPTAP